MQRARSDPLAGTRTAAAPAGSPLQPPAQRQGSGAAPAGPAAGFSSPVAATVPSPLGLDAAADAAIAAVRLCPSLFLVQCILAC